MLSSYAVIAEQLARVLVSKILNDLHHIAIDLILLAFKLQEFKFHSLTL